MKLLKSIGLVLLCALACAAMATTAAAQGSRKDDVVFGPTGQPMAGVSVAICTEPATTTTAPCSPLAALYSNSALTTPLANPLSTDGLGNYFFYAAPGKYTIQIYGPGITTRVLPDVILPSDPSSPTFTTVTTTSGISAFSLSLAGNLSVSGNVAVAGTLTVDGNPVTGGGGGGNLGANNVWTGNNSFKGPIPYWDVTAWGASGSNATTTGTIAASSSSLTLAGAQDFANGEGVMIPGAGPASSLAAPASLAGVVVGATGSTSHTYSVAAIDSLRGASPVATVTISNEPATLTATNYAQLAWNPVASAVLYAIYRDGAIWNVASAELPPPYVISSISRTGGTTTATINQNCAPCSYVIVGSQVTVTGTTNYNGTWTVTAIPAVNEIQWAQTGSAATETAGTIAQPIKWIDRGAGAIGTWPYNVPTAPPSSATAQWAIRTIASGGGTTSLTLSAAVATGVGGVTISHDDSAAINGALAACAAQRGTGLESGGIVYGPAVNGQYNAFGVLNFPSPYAGNSCAFQFVGTVDSYETAVLNFGWSLTGLGGSGITQFGNQPAASFGPGDGGAIPAIELPGGSANVSNIVSFGPSGGFMSGTYLEILNASNDIVTNVQAQMAATSYGPALKIFAACCWTHINYGTFHGNGYDDPVSISGEGQETPSNLVTMTDTVLQYGGIEIWLETRSLGAEFNNDRFIGVSSESANSSLFDWDTRNSGIAEMDIESGVMSDVVAHNAPLIDIVGYETQIYAVTVNNINDGGDTYSAVVSSSVLSNANTCPAIDGLTVNNVTLFGQIIQGTVCLTGFMGSNGPAGFVSSAVMATSDTGNTNGETGSQGGEVDVLLERPQSCTATPATSGGSLADGTYTYFMTALNGLDLPGTSYPEESWWSQMATATISGGGGAGKVTVACSASAGAASYKLYGRTGGAIGVTGYVAGSSPTIIDTGSALTTASLPNAGYLSSNAPVTHFPANGNSYILQGDFGLGTAAPSYQLDATGQIRAQAGFVNGGHLNQSAANTDFAGASACASGAKTVTFANAYSSTPVILIFDETTHGGASLSAKSASAFAVACTGASDAFDYIVIGNPN